MKKGFLKRTLSVLLAAALCAGFAAVSPVTAQKAKAADNAELFGAYHDVLTQLRQDEADELIEVQWVIIRDIVGDEAPELLFVVEHLVGNYGPYREELFIYGGSTDLTAFTYLTHDGKEEESSGLSLGWGYYEIFLTNDGALWIACDSDHVWNMYYSYILKNGVLRNEDYIGITWYADPDLGEEPFINSKDVTFEEYNQYVADIKSRISEYIITDHWRDGLTGDYFTLEEALDYTASLIGSTFYDTPTTAWYAKYVKWAAENSVVTGYPDNTFRPNNTMTRAEFVQVLYSLAGKPSVAATTAFTDVKSGDWYIKAVSWAVESGITSGVGNGEFSPGGSVTREQAVAFLYKYAKANGDNADYSGVALTFTDKADISGWAIPAVQWSAANKIVSGYPDGTFGPQNTATRAEVVTILYGYIN
ncbi:MAG: S-layer homology domain-containing protein [Oscillospiraceae bacterium]|jgi:hypothetical protein|nr:S-layer homology domain-containing protein [Oscillospiraceae bacterium]